MPERQMSEEKVEQFTSEYFNDIVKRFETKFVKQKNGCWIWHKVTKNGYGEFSFFGENKLAHRCSWVFYRGEIPKLDDYHGTCVLHKCDNKLCVNPEHLFLGSNLENIQDSMRKNRRLRKLKLGDKEKIKALYATGNYSMKKVGKLFGVTHGVIHGVIHDKPH